MIVRHSEGIFKDNFYDKDSVKEAAKRLMLRGVVVCALCGGHLKLNDCYHRHIRDEDDNREWGWIAQGHCAACNKYPAIIPDFIMPYKHYKAEVIENVIAATEAGLIVEYLDGYSADVSTMRYWIRQFRERGAQAAGWLISILLELFGRHISALKLQNRTLLKQLARLLREYPDAPKGGIVGRVNVILTTQNCGFL